eukprot:6154322-Amphidinium_carterae.1
MQTFGQQAHEYHYNAPAFMQLLTMMLRRIEKGLNERSHQLLAGLVPSPPLTVRYTKREESSKEVMANSFQVPPLGTPETP